MKKEHYETNKEDILAKQKVYYEDNKDIVNKRNKDYRDNHKDKMKEYFKEHRAKNKEPIQCECGRMYNNLYKSSHIKTKIHIQLMNEKLKV